MKYFFKCKHMYKIESQFRFLARFDLLVPVHTVPDTLVTQLLLRFVHNFKVITFYLNDFIKSKLQRKLITSKKQQQNIPSDITKGLL